MFHFRPFQLDYLTAVNNKRLYSTLLQLTVMSPYFSYGDKAPKNPLARLLAIVWMLLSYILLSLVAANIISLLTTQHISRIQGTIGLKVDQSIDCPSKSHSIGRLNRPIPY